MNIFAHRFAILTASLKIQWVQRAADGNESVSCAKTNAMVYGDESMMKERSLRLLEGSAGC